MSAITRLHACTRWSVRGLTCGAALFALLLPGLARQTLFAQDTSPPPIVLVGNADYAPLSYLDNGVAHGFDVDVARAVGRTLRREIRIELMDWASAREQVLNGSAHGLLNLSISEPRREAWAFSDPTMQHDFGLFVRRDELVIRSVADLAGRRVGVAPRGFPEEFLRLLHGKEVAVVAGHHGPTTATRGVTVFRHMTRLRTASGTLFGPSE